VKTLLVQSAAVSPWTPRRQWEPPSVSLATIAAQTEGHDVRVLDMIVWRKRAKQNFLKTLERFRPEVIGFSAMTFQYDSTLRFAYLAKQFDPKIKTILGGYHASLFHKQIAASPDRMFWDYLVRGEGDRSLGELLDCIANDNRGIEKVAGISYRQGDEVFHNGARSLENLAELRIPARDSRIIPAWRFHMYLRVADAIETSRGCLHACNFCSIRQMYGKAYRLFPLDRVAADVEDAYGRGARHIFITDDNITQDMDRFEEICDCIRKLGHKNLRITTQASPLGFAQRPDVVKKMVEARIVNVFLGIENVSKRNLRMMHKPNTVELIRKGVQVLQNGGISVAGGIINGLRHDDVDCLRENYEFMRELGINSVMDQLMTPYPSTDVRKQLLDEGRVRNSDDFRWYDGYFANVATDHYDPAELNFVRWKLRREVLGMWRAKSADWRFFTAYTALWELGLRPLVWLNERYAALRYGVEGRYKLQMKHFLDLNDFQIEIPGYERPSSYHPIFGDTSDPYRESREQMLTRKLAFSPPPPAAIPGPTPETAQEPAA
jgi:anaerobic magnesium-protoporphyrin IX monomethyl ester cyclase